jgi:vacuolar-type H+-ATPase subunit F/Vma7
MSRLLVVTRPELAPGFHLAGVNAYGVADVESAQELIGRWLSTGEAGLLAIDDGLLGLMDPAFLRRLEQADRLPHLPIPGGKPLGEQGSHRQRIAAMLRMAVGFHITFKGEEAVPGS